VKEIRGFFQRIFRPRVAGTPGIRWYTATDPGRVRTNNEDAVRAEPPDTRAARARGAVCVLADGVGGQAAGEIASRIAVDTVHDAFYAAPENKPLDEALAEAVRAANDAVWSAARGHATRAGMASTVTAAVVSGHTLVLAHVGDSRAYVMRGQRLEQITRDHSWVAAQVEAGVLTREQARKHSRRNIVLRALGQGPTVEVDLYHYPLERGDIALLCSDGLTTVVDDDEIAASLEASRPEKRAETLIAFARARGGPDNITVACAAL
jgi:protein phosphatase